VRFFLGVHHPNWLTSERLAGIPLFVSRNQLDDGRKELPEAVTIFALDSGGFTALQRDGKWVMTVAEYVDFVLMLKKFYGARLVWVAPQDWMCEPLVINGGRGPGGIVFVGTKLSVEEHQRRTVANFVELRGLLGELVVPTLQGWKLTDYWRCEEMYRDAGVDLASERLVAVGSVCRRQNTDEAATIMETLASGGLRLHGFGFKKQGIIRCAGFLASADSMAWSKAGWKRPNQDHAHIVRSREPGMARKQGAAKNCANCLDYALEWHADLVREVEQTRRAA
jgi:hypothetical protein